MIHLRKVKEFVKAWHFSFKYDSIIIRLDAGGGDLAMGNSILLKLLDNQFFCLNERSNLFRIL